MSAGEQPFRRSDGKDYAAFRPSYPPTLAAALAEQCIVTKLAVDIGCGTGQFTQLLAPHFERVLGIDSSPTQLAHAVAADNISYSEQTAERLALGDGMVDLLVVAQAAHWFDLERFYGEARRVARAGAVLALITYGVPRVEGPANAAFQRGYWGETHAFWPDERAHVESAYSELPFPFDALHLPACETRRSMTLDEFLGYVSTWSAYTRAVEAGSGECFARFFAQIAAAWPRGQRYDIVWPLIVRAARIAG